MTNSISPPNDTSKNRPAADCPTAALGHTGVKTLISVNAARVASPPTTCIWTTIFASAGNIVLPPSFVVPGLGITNYISGSTAAAVASVALLVKSVNFIILNAQQYTNNNAAWIH